MHLKKAIAAIGASALGLGGAAIAGAAPASADPLPACTDATQHVVNPALEPGDNWYMACMPQYGMGKAEFTITTSASDPFPAGYSLIDNQQTVTSSPTQAEVQSYFGASLDTGPFADPTPTYSGAFTNLYETDSTSTSQTYSTNPDFLISNAKAMNAAFPIVSASAVTSGFPAGCSVDGATYQGEFEVVYGPTTTTFSETIDNVVHKATITFTPPPLYLGLNFGSDGGFDDSMPLCESSGSELVFSPNETDDAIDWQTILFAATDFLGNATLTPITVGPDVDVPDPAVIAAANTENFGTFAATSTPVLATTGVDPTPAGELGLGLLGAGAVVTTLGVLWRRRRFVTRATGSRDT